MAARNNVEKRDKKERTKKKGIEAEDENIHPNPDNWCVYGGRRKEQITEQRPKERNKARALNPTSYLDYLVASYTRRDYIVVGMGNFCVCLILCECYNAIWLSFAFFSWVSLPSVLSFSVSGMNEGVDDYYYFFYYCICFHFCVLYLKFYVSDIIYSIVKIIIINK